MATSRSDSESLSRAFRRWFLGALTLCAVGHASAAATDALGLDEAVERALAAQPILVGADAQARASRETAVARAQLPDPMLFAGVRDLPIEGDEAFSTSDDSDTQLIVGIEQTVPTREKRRLRQLEATREGAALDGERARLTTSIRRDAALAWLAVWRESRAIDLLRAQSDDAALEVDAVATAQGAARATLRDTLAATLVRERLRDTLAAREQSLATARSALSRWIGAEAARPVADRTVMQRPAPTLDAILDALPRHPEVTAIDARIATARVAEDLADAERRPDWRVEFGYGHRREFSDMVMLQVGVGLPLFAGNRQDRVLASSRLRTQATQAQKDDALRRLAADAERVVAEAARLDDRLAHFDNALLPTADAAVDAALADLRAGRGSLASVLATRRDALEIALARLELEAERAARDVDIDYLVLGDVP
jgi:outer membrane protein TolC